MMPPRPMLRLGWAMHKIIHRLSGGRLSTARPSERRVGTLFLVTTGRTSGEPRTNAIYFVEDGRDLVVVASNAGEDRDPGWWLNLQAKPDAIVELRGSHVLVRARQASPQEEARLWPRLDAGYAEYSAYRAKTSRRIPVVILEPR